MPQPPQVRRSSLTSRAAVLALVLCTLVLMLAYPVQQYLAQRGVMAKLHRANTAAQLQVDALAFSDLRRAMDLGNALIALQPPRGYGIDPAAVYHTPDLPPTHHYYALYRWLRQNFC